MKSYREDHEQHLVSEQAASWLCELADDEPGRREAFVAWLKRSPRHVGEFLTASMVWRDLGRAAPIDASEIERIVAEARAQEASSNVVTLPGAAGAVHDSRRAMAKRLRRAASIAAGIAIVALGSIWTARLISAHAHVYSTAIGEQRAFRLPDGSLMQLNTRSRIEVRFAEHARDIRLLEGEALFTVHHDPARPFRVVANGVVIQAIGTQFNVYRRVSGTTVSVIEGVVQISADDSGDQSAQGTLTGTGSAVSGADERPGLIRVTAGERADLDAKGKILNHGTADVAHALAWRERRLVFQDDRLEDIVAEVNRYTPGQIRVEGDTARSKRITGTFDADDPRSLVLFLEKVEELSVEAHGETFTIRGREPQAR